MAAAAAAAAHVDEEGLPILANAAALFAAETARKNFKFEVIYVAVLSCLEVLHACLLLDWNWTDCLAAATLALRAAVVAFRWCGRKVDAPWRLLALASVALEAWTFALASVLGAALGAFAGSMLAGAMLLYAVLFMWSLRRSLVLGLLCFLAYVSIALARRPWLPPQGGEELGAEPCGDGLAEAALGISSVAISACLGVAAKLAWERTNWELFLREKTQQAIEAKVQRFQAEFANEVDVHTVVRRSITGDMSCQSASFQSAASYARSAASVESSKGGHGDPEARASGDPPRKATATFTEPSVRTQRELPGQTSTTPSASLHSAPAVLVHRTPAVTRLDTEDRMVTPCLGDCLPPDALVFVEGDALPKSLSEVAPGQRVLCFDRLGGHLKHASVLDTRMETGGAEWARLTLDDDTVLDMTADHPVLPISPRSEQRAGGVRPVVRASDVQPGVDSLMVLKVVPVKVKRVEMHRSDRPRVYMAVQQPERHAVFVSTPSGPSCTNLVQPVAVESANAHRAAVGEVGVKNTFLHISGGDRPALRHSRSLPPYLLPDPSDDADLSGGAAASLMEVQAAAAAAGAQWDSESQGSPHSSLGQGETQVILGGSLVPTWERTGPGQSRVVGAQAAPCTSQIALSDSLGVKAAGWSSIGSLRHAEGVCSVCLFENRRQHRRGSGRPCYKGTYCERCHEEHVKYKTWKGQYLEKKRSSDGYPSIDYRDR